MLWKMNSSRRVAKSQRLQVVALCNVHEGSDKTLKDVSSGEYEEERRFGT